VPAGAQVSPVTASVADTLGVIGTVLVPLVARGVIIRRPRVAAVGERLDADRRLVRTLQRLRTRYGTGPLRLRLPLRRVVLVLSHEDAHRVLDASPDPYATAAREKKAVLGRFEPHGVLISDAADRPARRRWNEVVLDTSAPLHHLAGPMVTVVREEADALLAEVASGDGVLDWSRFVASWFRIARRVTLGDAARDDTVLTDQLARLRGQANWLVGPVRPAPRDAFLGRLRAHLERAEPGSLAAVAASSPATPRTAAVEQVPQWLFAFDAAGISCFRALALLSTHPRELAAVRGELADRDLDTPAMLQTLRAALLEAVRLWPTTPAILRETTTATELGGRTLPSDTLVAIIAPLFHRDRERYSWADDFTPRLWAGEAGAASPRAALVPFSEGPAVCAGQNLVLFLTSTLLAALLRDHEVRVTSRPPIRPGRPLPGTLDPFYLRFSLTPRR
jgi:hypothetical protein